MLWLIYAFISALTNAIGIILTKVSIKEMNVVLATVLQSMFIAVILIPSFFLSNKKTTTLTTLSTLTSHNWTIIILASIAGSLSWIFYFWALKHGFISRVEPVVQFGSILVVVLAAPLIGEPISPAVIIGVLLTLSGMYLISMY